jgi:hypothetical protein
MTEVKLAKCPPYRPVTPVVYRIPADIGQFTDSGKTILMSSA